MGKKLTTAEFVKKAIEVHGDKYDYSKVEYMGTHKNVCIICPMHGNFLQTPANHLNGRGCPKCGGNGKLTASEFIKRAREVHSDKYNYSKVEYVNSKKEVCIICPKHGKFLQRPSDHLNGRGCPKCGVESKQKKVFFND